MLQDNLSAERVYAALVADPEFAMGSRSWTGQLVLVIGGRALALELHDGTLTGVTDEAFDGRSATDGVVVISGPDGDWDKMLQPVPEPFYQDFYPASQRHDLRLDGEPETLWAFYPAIRRTGDVLRSVAAEGTNNA